MRKILCATSLLFVVCATQAASVDFNSGTAKANDGVTITGNLSFNNNALILSPSTGSYVFSLDQSYNRLQWTIAGTDDSYGVLRATLLFNDSPTHFIYWGGEVAVSSPNKEYTIDLGGPSYPYLRPFNKVVWDAQSQWWCNNCDTPSYGGLAAIKNVTFSNYVASVSPVPEPSTYMMMLAGLAVVSGAARRIKKSNFN